MQIGDKETSFVGSRKWIGSTEVSYVLDHLLGVSSFLDYCFSGHISEIFFANTVRSA